MNKTAPINLMVSDKVKKNLQDKANALGLTLTGYIEKIAGEPVIFLDDNARLLIKTLSIT